MPRRSAGQPASRRRKRFARTDWIGPSRPRTARALLSGGGSAMPRPRRTHLDAPFFHVLNRSVRRAPIFRRPQDYRAFLGVLQEGLERFPVRLVAFCVLSNRWHLVLEPAGTEGMIRFMHWVSTTHAVRWHLRRASKGNGPVYQGRYHSIPIEGTGDLMRICRYVERHALTAGLVRRAQDWPWCSLAERLRTEPEVSLKPARFLTSQAWIDHVNAAGPLWEQVDDPADLVRCDRVLRTLTRAPAPRQRDRVATTGRAPRPASTRAPGQPPC